MLSELGRLALALGALFGIWSSVAAHLALSSGRAGVARSARRGLVAAMACALLGTLVLSLALFAGDTRVAFVASHSSVLMPGRYLVNALLSEPGGALPAFAAQVAIVALVVARVQRESVAARAWTVAFAGGVVGIALVVAALADPLVLRSARIDGLGLPPELQHGAATVQAIGLLVGTALAFAAFALSAAALATRSVGDAWSRAIRPWNAVAFVALSAGLIASACGSALYPVTEPWLAQRTTTVWLFTCAVSAWLVYLDRRRQGLDTAVMRLLLTAAVFVASTTALALTGGGFDRPVFQGNARNAYYLALLPVSAIAVTISFLRTGKGALADARGVTSEPKHRVAFALAIAGLVMLLATAGGSYAARSHNAQIADTEILRVRDPFGAAWSFKSQGVSTLKRENFASYTLTLLPQRDSTRLDLLSAEARSYLLADESDAAPPIGVSAVRHGVLLDVRAAIDEPDAKRPSVRITFVPLASWLWPGAVLLWLGVLLFVAPRKETAT